MLLLKEAKRRINAKVMEASALQAQNHQFVAGLVNAGLIINELLQEEEDKMAEFYGDEQVRELTKVNLSDL